MDPFSTVASALTLLKGVTTVIETAIDYRGSARRLEQLEQQLKSLEFVESSLASLLREHHFDNVNTRILDLPLERLHSARRKVERNFKRRAKLAGSRWRHRRTIRKNQINEVAKDIQDARIEFQSASQLLTLSLVADRLSQSSLLETSTFPHAERYVAGECVYPTIHLYSSLEVSRNPSVHTRKYFVIFAQDSRLWRRITMIVTLPACSDLVKRSAANSLYMPGEQERSFPKQLRSQFEQVLRNVQHRLYYTATQIKIDVKLDDKELELDSTQCNVQEDHNEVSTASAHELHPWLLAHAHFRESEVIIVRLLRVDVYVVRAGPTRCIQWRLPFAAGGGERNLAEEFKSNLRLTLAAQGCPYVTKFVGAVLSDDNRLLRSSLLELPAQGAIIDVIMRAKMTGGSICWARRAKWIRQLVTALAKIHKRGIALGVVHTTTIWLDSIDNVSLPQFQLSSSGLRPLRGAVPPELRGADWTTLPGHKLGEKSDIFQLGLTIWMIAQSLVITKRAFCEGFPCTNPWNSICKEAHANPIELPECSPDVPAYINDIIHQCRCTDPAQRISAAGILPLLEPPCEEGHVSTEDIVDLCIPQLRSHCDICGTIFTTERYDCEVCAGGNYSLCSACIQAGTHCPDKSHQLHRRSRKSYRWVDEGT